MTHPFRFSLGLAASLAMLVLPLFQGQASAAPRASDVPLYACQSPSNPYGAHDARTAAELRPSQGVVTQSVWLGWQAFTVSNGTLLAMSDSRPSTNIQIVSAWQGALDCWGNSGSGNTWEVTPTGAVYTDTWNPFAQPVGNYGSMAGQHLNQPIVGMSPTADGKGYWLVASDGGIFQFGDAHFYGSTGNVHLSKPIVGMAATPDGKGYWMVASDGGVFDFGDAKFYGSLGAVHLNRPITGMTPTPDGKGYWMVASDGGVFDFGDAKFYGSAGGEQLTAPIAGMIPNGGGYTLVGEDGTLYPFGAQS